MKYSMILILIYLLLPDKSGAQQGSTCSTPYPVLVDGVLRSYAPSSNLAAAVVCTSYTNNSPVTWFSITTNAQGECPLLNISSGSTWCEIALYTACNGGQALQTASAMCFDDGSGLWAPSEALVLQANTTYYLRIKTAGADSIRMAAQHYTPSNNSCLGATSVSTVSIHDNNACHKPGTGIFADQLCAFTLENTAFYQFYIASPGSAIINISSISCDNGSQNNSSGFQIGFFTGSCNALVPLNCTSGSGTFVQASTDPLPANTHVYVAIDGMAGSNCRYSLEGINVFGVLAAEQLNKFSAWNAVAATVLRWETKNDQSVYFEVERSVNGIDYSRIGRVYRNQGNKPVHQYDFEDRNPQKHAYYRVKQLSKDGHIAISPVIRTQRENLPLNIQLTQPVAGWINITITNPLNDRTGYSIINSAGQVLMQGSLNCTSETTVARKNISALPAGNYFMVFTHANTRISQAFIKR